MHELPDQRRSSLPQRLHAIRMALGSPCPPQGNTAAAISSGKVPSPGQVWLQLPISLQRTPRVRSGRPWAMGNSSLRVHLVRLLSPISSKATEQILSRDNGGARHLRVVGMSNALQQFNSNKTNANTTSNKHVRGSEPSNATNDHHTRALQSSPAIKSATTDYHQDRRRPSIHSPGWANQHTLHAGKLKGLHKSDARIRMHSAGPADEPPAAPA